MKKTILLILPLVLAGCYTGGPSQSRGIATGAAVGGALGGIIGKQSGETRNGAILGAAVGSALGGLMGKSRDKEYDRRVAEQHRVSRSRVYSSPRTYGSTGYGNSSTPDSAVVNARHRAEAAEAETNRIREAQAAAERRRRQLEEYDRRERQAREDARVLRGY